MKVLVTGTHFTPAVATIKELKKFKGTEVTYVGRKTTQEGDSASSIESQVLPSMGVKFIPIITGRLQRDFTIYTIPSLLKIPIGFFQSFLIILSEKPDVLLSFGGYVAVPLVIVSWLLSIPIIVHEQTLVTGLANRISAFFADKIAVSFKDSQFRGEKVLFTGNPVRREIIEASIGVERIHPKVGLPTVLIMGGNQGSHIINLAVEGCLERLLQVARVYHQTGDSKFRDFERLEEAGKSKGWEERYTVRKWIGKDYPEILQEADLVVSRAGINTLSELALLGKPALLVPIPNREQRKNAKYFENLKLTKTLPQSEVSGETLLQNIKHMLKNINSLKEKAKGVKKIITPDAAKKLALETILLVKKTNE